MTIRDIKNCAPLCTRHEKIFYVNDCTAAFSIACAHFRHCPLMNDIVRLLPFISFGKYIFFILGNYFIDYKFATMNTCMMEKRKT
ncbi:MAG: hypothetical protein V4805_13480 [Pseudomonadota bacterium]